MYGSDLGLGERAHAVADEAVLVGQREVDHAGIVRGGGRGGALQPGTNLAPRFVSTVEIVRLAALR